MENKKNTPLKLNSRLIKAARETARYSGGDMSTLGTWNVDKMFDPAKEVMAKRMLKKEMEKKQEELKNNPKNNNKIPPKNNKIVGPNEGPEEKITPPPPKRYETIDCSETPGEDGYHPDCWMGVVSIETEEWIKWNEEHGQPPVGNDGPKLYMKSPMKHPAEESNLKGYKKGLKHVHKKDGSWKWVSKGVSKNYEQKAKPHRNTPKTPFQRYSALKTNVRNNYIPEISKETSPLQQSSYSSDRFSEGIYGGALPEINVNSVWNTFEDLPKEKLEEIKINSITNDISSNEEWGTPVKPIEKIPNKEWRGTITKYLNFCRENIVNAVKDGQTDFKEVWMNNARNLVTNIQQFEEKRKEWGLNNAGDETSTNKGGSMVSNGSHRGDSRLWDFTYLGAPNMNMDISEEGDMYFKLTDVDDIWTVKDLDRNVFNKDYRGLQIWTDLKKELVKSAREGKAFNMKAIEGVVAGIIQTPEAANSWAHDNLDGENMFDQYYKSAAEKGIEINPDPFMVEHPDYNIDIINDMVKNGMINMAKQIYDSGVVGNKKTAEGLSARELMKKYA